MLLSCLEKSACLFSSLLSSCRLVRGPALSLFLSLSFPFLGPLGIFGVGREKVRERERSGRGGVETWEARDNQFRSGVGASAATPHSRGGGATAASRLRLELWGQGPHRSHRLLPIQGATSRGMALFSTCSPIFRHRGLRCDAAFRHRSKLASRVSPCVRASGSNYYM